MAIEILSARNFNGELIELLRQGLPNPIRKYWHRADALQTLLQQNGLPALPDKSVSSALKGNIKQLGDTVIGTNRYGNRRYYCVEDPANRMYDTPKLQMRVMSGDWTEDVEVQQNHFISNEQKMNEMMPGVGSNYFAQFQLHHLKHCAVCEPGSPASTNINDLATVTPSPPIALTKNKESARSLPLESPGERPIGLAFTAIGKNSECIRIAEEHARKCPGKCRLKLSKRVKSGFELIETHSCGFCLAEYTVKSGPSADPNVKKKRGGQISEISKIISHSVHGAAVNPAQLGEFLDQAGCVRANDSGLHKMFRRRKDNVKIVCKSELKKNRIEHNAVIRSKYGSKYDIKFVDSDGVQHTICSRPVASDGAGETRAYNHRITGRQHVTVLYSVETGKPLMVWHDQVSCVHCQRKLTELIDGGKKHDEITEEDFSHPGKPCYRNTKHGPAVAEEYAMEKMARYLLVDPETGKFRSDEEAILGREIIADGDTKGSKRFIKVQSEIVPSFVGVAEYFPDIGHFVKCISGGFHKLASNNAELRGVSLLESARIKAMVADISRILREYGQQYKGVGVGTGSAAKVNALREVAIARIASIIPHHCGDHSNCRYVDCQMIKLRRHFCAKYRAEHPDSEAFTNKEILRLHKEDIAIEYARISRFRGKVMSMGEVGRGVVYREIASRLNETNIDRVARAMSSNNCENFFNILAKFSHGKRINNGLTDSWEVFQLLVAGQRSDLRIEDKIQAHAGIASSFVRDRAIDQQVWLKEYHQKRKRTEKYKRRRKISQVAKVHKAVKNTTAPARHRPNKQSPTDACKSEPALKAHAAVGTKKTRKRKCRNCGLAHTGGCEEPEFSGTKKARKTKKQKQAEELEAKMDAAMSDLFG
ncbi:hypothetical protein ACHAWF_015517 [Thalassiosira exigua]